jgi:hypothetical protein
MSGLPDIGTLRRKSARADLPGRVSKSLPPDLIRGMGAARVAAPWFETRPEPVIGPAFGRTRWAAPHHEADRARSAVCRHDLKKAACAVMTW